MLKAYERSAKRDPSKRIHEVSPAIVILQEIMFEASKVIIFLLNIFVKLIIQFD